MSDRIYIGNKGNKFSSKSFRLQGLLDSPLVSDDIRISTCGTYSAVDVPPGAIVHKVGLWNKGTAISGATLNVGYGGTYDVFLDGVSAMAVDDIVMSGVGGTVAADPVGGRFFADGVTIKLQVATGGSDESTVKVLVWWTGSDA